ncbi:MAG: hypothetical protein HY726_13685 [Candidatus Rokubacteria bacterium]|nr:hypothetical protein [Candidatus Rokubacteria bacterium]
MKRSVAIVLASLLLGGLAATPAPAQQIKPVGPGSASFTTPDGTNFRFGISLDYQPMTVKGLDFNRRTNFRTINEFGVFGEEDTIIGFENRLFFTVTKGRLSLYTAIELDGALDEREIDANNPNIERLNLSLLIPEVNTTFTVGADIYAVDQIGGLVYIDDDPGIWFKGGAGPWSWQAGWHKRTDFGGAAGDSGFRFAARVSNQETREDDTEIFSAKIGYNFAHPFGRFLVEPFGIYYLRNTPHSGAEQNRLNAVGPGAVARPADPLQASLDNIQPNQDTGYLGIQGTGTIGWLRPSAEFVYLVGRISGLRDRVTGTLPFGRESFDIHSLATYLRLDFDWSKERWWPLRGVIPFVSAEFLRGDDDPFDDDLKGFVSPSSPNGLRPGDLPLIRKTVLGLGSPIIGDGTADFGFGVDGRGIGPTIGNIFEGATFGSAATFNNRFGKGDSPGYLMVSTGLQGSYNPQWDFHLIGRWLRYHRTEPIEAEFRAFNVGSVAPTIGAAFDVMVVFKPVPQYQIRPFFSIFFPGAGVRKISGGNEDAIVSGVNFFAIF